MRKHQGMKMLRVSQNSIYHNEKNKKNKQKKLHSHHFFHLADIYLLSSMY